METIKTPNKWFKNRVHGCQASNHNDQTCLHLISLPTNGRLEELVGPLAKLKSQPLSVTIKHEQRDCSSAIERACQLNGAKITGH